METEQEKARAEIADRDARLIAYHVKFPKLSLRKLAAVFHLSHETVRRVIKVTEEKKEVSKEN